MSRQVGAALANELTTFSLDLVTIIVEYDRQLRPVRVLDCPGRFNRAFVTPNNSELFLFHRGSTGAYFDATTGNLCRPCDVDGEAVAFSCSGNMYRAYESRRLSDGEWVTQIDIRTGDGHCLRPIVNAHRLGPMHVTDICFDIRRGRLLVVRMRLYRVYLIAFSA